MMGNENKRKNRKKLTLEDIIGIVDVPKIEGRFQEIISTQKILDTETDVEYDGFVDTELLILINELDKENKELKKSNNSKTE